MSKYVGLLRGFTGKGSIGSMFIGHVVKRSTANPNSLKVDTQKMILDKELKSYFSTKRSIWVDDNSKDCLIGDIVLIKSLPRNADKSKVTHEVDHIVFKLGCVVDPITGRRCRGTEFVDEADIGTEKPLVIEEVK
ncbi:28S ribosomal protein S17, mitochondrial-like [Mizuhopecten yessoensis]|uniref:28S ribosomal protein S17, mitochondrial n=1 Tax=Mizuhopecten yessoensis TaxID=6573 RepID=A0A210QUX1_MIZYE|nr:28S ribosomal protein S17, mitochondrial-like [Mizuhopecten yessoensis]OWF52548.1 28S ribosomal protein S17, mitochondrial [Mizuhopecten yessoensis]